MYMHQFTYKRTDPVIPTSVRKQIYRKSCDLPIFRVTSLYHKEKPTLSRYKSKPHLIIKECTVIKCWCNAQLPLNTLAATVNRDPYHSIILQNSFITKITLIMITVTYAIYHSKKHHPSSHLHKAKVYDPPCSSTVDR